MAAKSTQFSDLINSMRARYVEQKFPLTGNCFTCGKVSNLTCSKCHHRFFCGTSCQEKTFRVHSHECYALPKDLLRNSSNQVLLEAFNLGLFAEYKKLDWRVLQGNASLFEKVDCTIYGAFIEMIMIDPKHGDSPEEPELVEKFEAAQTKIKIAGHLLVEHGAGDLMRFYQRNPFIPKDLLRDLNFLWDGIGDWKA